MANVNTDGSSNDNEKLCSFVRRVKAFCYPSGMCFGKKCEKRSRNKGWSWHEMRTKDVERAKERKRERGRGIECTGCFLICKNKRNPNEHLLLRKRNVVEISTKAFESENKQERGTTLSGEIAIARDCSENRVIATMLFWMEEDDWDKTKVWRWLRIME